MNRYRGILLHILLLPEGSSIENRHTDRQTPGKVIPMCRYASQATQKGLLIHVITCNTCNLHTHKMYSTVQSMRGRPSLYYCLLGNFHVVVNFAFFTMLPSWRIFPPAGK